MNQTTQNLSFGDIPISDELSRAVDDMNYSAATSIQAATIPLLLDKYDVIGNSSTGTGKTAAFGIPAVEMVDSARKSPQVLVLSPTRELAMQIAGEMRKYGKYKEGVSVVAVYGGDRISEQIRQLRRANIVIGTPGRIMDHLRRKTLKLTDVKMVVLDEADEMLSMGFIEDIQTILTQAPEERQTVLFSATMPPAILKISEQFLRDPKIINVMAEKNNQADIAQTYYYVPQSKKQDALKLLLDQANPNRSIIFCNTKSMVDELTAVLVNKGFAAAGLHGDMTQIARSKVMENFRSGISRILIATDVAARGIDINDVDIVFNYDLPQSFEYYIHRIGRTGRAGKQGMAQTLICNGKQMITLKNLMRFTGSEIREGRLPSTQDLMDQSVSKTAEELLSQIERKTGKAAKQLVALLLKKGEELDLTPEMLMEAMASQLIGDDKQYETVKIIEKVSVTKKETGRQGGRRSGSPKVVVTANIGRDDHVMPNHIVGALTELLDISGSDIGKINIGLKETSIGICAEGANMLIHLDKPVRINRCKVLFTADNQPKKQASPARSTSQQVKQPYMPNVTRRRKNTSKEGVCAQ